MRRLLQLSGKEVAVRVALLPQQLEVLLAWLGHFAEVRGYEQFEAHLLLDVFGGLPLLDFEQGYEKLGMPALAIQVASGLWMALQLVPDWRQWFSPSTGLERAVALSHEKYCSASIMLAKTAEITTSFELIEVA